MATLLLPAAWSAAASPHSTRAEPSEYELKAAYLFHFFRYVRWPKEAFEDSASPFVLLVVGEDPFERRLDETLRGKRIGQRSIEIRRVPDLKDLPPAHMLFLARNQSPQLPVVLEHCAGSSTMVVTDAPGLAERGAVLGFFLSDRRVRFEVNVDAARRAGLEVSSQLLKLARVVRDAQREGGAQ